MERGSNTEGIDKVISVLSSIILSQELLTHLSFILVSILRMTTSQKYRFPTADCSESEKEEVRMTEEKIREEVSVSLSLFR